MKRLLYFTALAAMSTLAVAQTASQTGSAWAAQTSLSQSDGSNLPVNDDGGAAEGASGDSPDEFSLSKGALIAIIVVACLVGVGGSKSFYSS
jgi:hypothetical protein